MRAIGRVYAKAVMIERLLRKTADGEGKDESILIKVINNDMLITCGQSVDNSSTKGREGASLSSPLEPPTSGGSLRTKFRRI